MKTVWLSRTERSDQGTFGHLICEALHLHTGELPWRGNERMVSCIPTGTYIVHWEPVGKFKGYAIQTKGSYRNNIEIHSGNWCGDVSKGFKSNVLGCICLGLKRGKLTPYGFTSEFKQEALLSSGTAMKKFHEFFNQEGFLLIIEDKFNEEAAS